MRFLDSHTAGEPTRLILEGGPDLGPDSLADRRERFRQKFDAYRTAMIGEPRGSDVLVGALLVPPHEPECEVGVIYFNNVGPLGMCGHATIGLVVSLAYLGRLKRGLVRIDTPVGVVTAELHSDGSVSVANVPSYREARNVTVAVPGHGSVTGDVAWGGNWFFLVSEHGLSLSLANLEKLTDFARRVRRAINAQGFPQVDHVELVAPGQAPGTSGRNFVLCPGSAYDRSPCGTGTSAKLACLAADGKLAEGDAWVQEGILGSTFTGRYRWQDRATGRIWPTITGTAFITAEGTLHLDPADPFCWGIRS